MCGASAGQRRSARIQARPATDQTPMPATPALEGLSIFERGWLSSNNVLLHGQGAGAVLVDSGHMVHGEQTVALLRQSLGGEALQALVNTHLHSDHCGGNAAVQRALGGRIMIPPGSWAAARAWDEDALSYRPTGQRCERFVPDAVIEPGDTLVVGRRRWQALAAPGHDPHSIILHDAEHAVVISADALWENGFGVVFPELEGEPAFDEVRLALDLIESLDARWAIPGHGAPFTDLRGALQRARRRLAAFVADPERHARHAVKVLVKYHLLEEKSQPWPAFERWFCAAALCHAVWERLGAPEGRLAAFGERIVRELADSGALVLRDGVIHDAV
jgi:glyoxylase-like metal-dependent hydrolase (beta-lactamase superfamily II)